MLALELPKVSAIMPSDVEATSEPRLNLPSIRRNRGVSLRSIADETKIGMRYLEAIESENFSRLPGEIYTVSYIRQYAKAIDYDESLILNVYSERSGACQEIVCDPIPERRAAGTLCGFFRVVRRHCRRLLTEPL